MSPAFIHLEIIVIHLGQEAKCQAVLILIKKLESTYPKVEVLIIGTGG